jgi:hypothetical protein
MGKALCTTWTDYTIKEWQSINLLFNFKELNSRVDGANFFIGARLGAPAKLPQYGAFGWRRPGELGAIKKLKNEL